jgi:methylthioribose-1-phosphate isomerase
MHDKIPFHSISDGMAASLMRAGKVDFVIAGADRIAANGDTANKIGTYMVAVLAHRHGIPFYVACPLSTIDMQLPNGDAIPIEERSPDEVTGFGAQRWAPQGVKVRNPAFDVTPAELVSALITEKGVVHQPNEAKLKKLFQS